MKKYFLLLFFSIAAYMLMAQQTITLSMLQLQDKIKGGWAGQTIGVTFGGLYEFRYNGTFIQDYQPLHWDISFIKENMLNNAGLYDDLYMDLTFVDVFEKYGLHAPVDSFANAFAHAGYKLWHANQAARYNILNGIKAPASGYWENNVHADDIDYQIESDYAGLMSPAMPNTASAISDKIGHIMNYGDGWYGGVFIGAMYTLAFVYDDVDTIISEALKTIPAQSTYYKCISDVIQWHKQFPNDWKRTWYALQVKWAEDVACPGGVFEPFNIDAKINSAYVVTGLLYGNGDFTKSLEIATRCGQDADCNPSSVGGILGTILGYNKIPACWKNGLHGAEDINFKYTDISLNKVYNIGVKQALQNIAANGGSISGDKVVIAVQQPKAVKLEQGFANIHPKDKIPFEQTIDKEISFSFEGTGFCLAGEALKNSDALPEHIFIADLYIDGNKTETAWLPTDFTTRRNELFWKYNLQPGKHTVMIRLQNPADGYALKSWFYIVY
ncbi:ADP-ribosylglycohydrolase family protein [Parafilimonas sp.]|uniref:ADP-ribosylglycohydrolase family protein n=1 Tax=Parafilimonas sp. TaxID=1969739 RepID=UPI0039E71903